VVGGEDAFDKEVISRSRADLLVRFGSLPGASCTPRPKYEPKGYEPGLSFGKLVFGGIEARPGAFEVGTSR
jgi:hypothetical protein